MINPSDLVIQAVQRPRNIVFSSMVPIGTKIDANLLANGEQVQTFSYTPVQPCSDGNILRCVITIDFIEDRPTRDEAAAIAAGQAAVQG